MAEYITKEQALDIIENSADIQEAKSCVLYCEAEDVKPVIHAKWIDKSHISGCGIRFIASECSNCKKKTLFDCKEFIFDYCPNCGAKMDKKENYGK